MTVFYCWVIKFCMTHYCDPLDCSRPGSSVLHDLPELVQIHVHWFNDDVHLILCHPLLLLPSIFPRIRVFSNESVLCIRRPKYWSFSFSISPSNEHSGLISFGWTGWISLLPTGLSRVFSNTTVQSINSSALSFLYSPTITSIHEYWKNHSFD